MEITLEQDELKKWVPALIETLNNKEPEVREIGAWALQFCLVSDLFGKTDLIVDSVDVKRSSGGKLARVVLNIDAGAALNKAGR